jgi:uncharacterized hydrophobic protein (TIGR00271 family)
MVHLRIVAPAASVEEVLERLSADPTIVNVVRVAGASVAPEGDLILCDVAREQASVLVEDLGAMGLRTHGSISVDNVDTVLSKAALAAEKRAPGAPADAVVWEDVESRTFETASLSGVFCLFMVLAALIAAVGLFYDSPILVVGAMVVGPEFGPVAGFCVAAVNGSRALAIRSFVALVVGFPLAIVVTALATLLFEAMGVIPHSFDAGRHALSDSIAQPDFFAFFVAFCAGIAGMVSLSTAKSGALIGVLISVTTIPAAANASVTAALGDWHDTWGSLGQLGVNLVALITAGMLTLWIQRRGVHRRRAAARRRA